jgi:hypothetical protein
MRRTYEAPSRITKPNVHRRFMRSDTVVGCNENPAMDGLPSPSLGGQGVVAVLIRPLQRVAARDASPVMVWDVTCAHLHSAM